MYKVTYPLWRVGAIVGLPITLLAEGWGGDDAVWPSARLAHVAELGPRFCSICFSFGFSKVSRFGVPCEEFHALADIEIARVGTAANIVFLFALHHRHHTLLLLKSSHGVGSFAFLDGPSRRRK